MEKKLYKEKTIQKRNIKGETTQEELQYIKKS